MEMDPVDDSEIADSCALPQTEQTSLSQKIWSALGQLFTWKVLKPVLCGQGLSILICGTAITSKYLLNFSVDLPLTQSLINYILLGLVYTTTLAMRRTENGNIVLFQILRESWWKYILLAVVDVEANYMILLAYQYTSLTSVQLLDCFILPVVMVLSYFLFKVRYLFVHFLGVVVALVGVGCMVGADALVGKGGSAGPNPALGDVLVLGGAVCYGISNVSMEYISKKRNAGNVEFLGMYGLFCPIVSGIQVAILERQKLASVQWSIEIVLLFAAFAVCMFLLYSLMPIVMRLSSATAVNISLLTADLYALFAGLFLFHDQMSALYAVSFVTIVISLIIYNSKQPLQRNPQTSSRNSRSSSVRSLPPIADEESSQRTLSYGTSFRKASDKLVEENVLKCP